MKRRLMMGLLLVSTSGCLTMAEFAGISPAPADASGRNPPMVDYARRPMAPPTDPATVPVPQLYGTGRPPNPMSTAPRSVGSLPSPE